MTPATRIMPSRSVSKKTTEEPEEDDIHVLVPDTTFSRTWALFQRLERDAAANNGRFDGLVVGNVSPADFRRIEMARDRRHPKYRLFFLEDIACAIITVPSKPHEIGQNRLSAFVDRAVYRMGEGVDDSWVAVASTKFQPTGGASSGEGDSAAGPRRGNSDDTTEWPTLVLEVGVSQSMACLRTKSRPESAGQTIRPGATTTRAVARRAVLEPACQQQRRAVLEPACQQQMVISWTGPAPILQTPRHDRAAGLFAVTGAPLILGFEELFLRPPVQAHGEHDIIISASNLQDLASRMWEGVL
ncbi:hypothetical protein SCUCBS95973_001620 [Sporothrix curviconia]|uniref:Uncharacterized protein n=1 Tax=Sporothrix curviconia TaxID=1260050 RepID=A0ABP0B061_9PEZI